jgi:hypothetical protein
MIDSLKFKKFNLEFLELTTNTILLFDNIENLREFYKEFENLITDIEYNNILYSTKDDIEKIEVCECSKCRGFTAIYKINNTQRFIFTLEPMSILTMTNYHDLWFVKKDKSNWSKFAFTDYKNYENFKNNEDIYKFVCESRYGFK